MGQVKRDRWTEAEVCGLPSGENDLFDRKSGQILLGTDWNQTLGKPLSAFANSGGGSIILGAKDDGTFDGVDPKRGRQPTKDWLEQVLSDLLDYRLDDLRVHVVEPASPSTIPTGKQVIVVDVGDSRLAPHQCKSDKTYYYRVGSHSKPAPHFYLEVLRNRLVGPALEASVKEIRLEDVTWTADRVKITFRASFAIKNVGRLAAYKWHFLIDQYFGCPDGSSAAGTIFAGKAPQDGISLDDTILPSLEREAQWLFGMTLYGTCNDHDSHRDELDAFAANNWSIGFRAVSETSPGETKQAEVFKYVALSAVIDRVCSG